MPVWFEIISASGTPERIEIPDGVDEIRIGRGSDCQVRLDPDDTRISRRHVTITGKSGKYTIDPERHSVKIAGRKKYAGDELPEEGEFEFGQDHRIKFGITVEGSALRPTDDTITEPPTGGQVAHNRRLVALALGGLLVLGLVVGGMEIIRGEPDLSRALNKAKRSVYLVLACKEPDISVCRNLDDKTCRQTLKRACLRNAKPIATAWAIGKSGTLVTNEHVVRGFRNSLTANNEQLWVRQSVPPWREFRIVGVTVPHAAGRFRSAWKEYRGVLDRATTRIKPKSSSGTGTQPGTPSGKGPPGGDRARRRALPLFDNPYDVALLTVDTEGIRLEVLELASQETLLAMKSGETVGAVGFPMEGMVGGGVNQEKPEPKIRKGTITSITDYFLRAAQQPGDVDHRHLIHHSLEGTGGISGSPILNKFGRVVAVFSAGNVHVFVRTLVQKDGKIVAVRDRFPSSAGDRFAHRADLLRELLVQDPDNETGSDRERHFREGFRQHRSVSKYLLKKFFGFGSPKLVPLHEGGATWRRANGGDARAVYEFSLPKGGRVAVLGDVGVIDTTLEAHLHDKSTKRKRVGRETTNSPLPMIELKYLPSGKYKAIFRAREGKSARQVLGTELQVRVYLRPGPRPPKINGDTAARDALQ